MKGKGYAARRRKRLFDESPFCFWCKRQVRLVDLGNQPKSIPDDAATLDHLYSRLDLERSAKRRGPEEQRIVLACRACNQRRSREEVAALPIEEQWRRSGSYPVVGFSGAAPSNVGRADSAAAARSPQDASGPTVAPAPEPRPHAGGVSDA